MKLFAGLIALAMGQQWPSTHDTNDYFWLSAATESMRGSGGVSQITSISCRPRASVQGSGVGEKLTKQCTVHFESLGNTGGYSDVIACQAQVNVQVCKFCRQAPVAWGPAADCASTVQGPEAVPYGRGK